MSRTLSRITRAALLLGVSLATVTACGSDSKSSSTDATSPPAASTVDSADVPVATGVPTSDDLPVATGVPTSDDIAVTDPLPTPGAVPFSVETASGTLTLPAQPTKIISLAPTHTETLFAIGAGAEVIAVDDQSNYPPEAEAVKTDLSGYTPNVEAIAGYAPDLVVVSDDSGGIVAQLQALDIPVWVGTAADTLDETYAQIVSLGILTGHYDEATAVVGGMRTAIESALASLPESEVPLTYYHELDNTYYSITSNTFLGQIYSLAGLVNIADTTETDSDYPQLNSEFIISANPEIIFLADTKCCGESAETVAARDGWADIAAVKNGSVVAMDDDLASRWGPRVVDYVQAVVAAVQTASLVPAG